jgi:PAS domain S-box-containing protein
MRNPNPISRSRKPQIIGFGVLVTILLLTQYLTYQRYRIGKDNERQKIEREINAIKDRLKTSLSYSLSATKTLAFIVTEYGVPQNFDNIAKEILESNRYIDALQLTSGGVITHVYPMAGNEAVIGYNVLADSLRNKEAYRAIEKNELYFAGPFELRQGGMAVVGRLPIFKNNKFLGFSAVIIKLSTLLRTSGLQVVEGGDFLYQLSKINPGTQEEDFFLEAAIPFDHDQTAFIDVPDGEWKLYVTLKNHSRLYYNVITFSLLGLMLSVTAGLFAWHLARQPEKLENLVNTKTLQLARSEKYFRSLIEKSSDAIVLLDHVGKVLYQSYATHRISGYTLEEIQAKSDFELVHPDDRVTDLAMFTKLVESPGAAVKHTHRFKRKDGCYVWLEGTYTNLLHDENVKAIVYNYHDITDRVEAEEKIVQERNLSESTINSLPGIFYLYDRNGKFLRWNKNFELVSGYSRQEVATLHPLDLFNGQDKELLRHKIDTVFNHGSADVEARFVTKDKKSIPYYFNGNKISINGFDYLIGVGFDISLRVAAENAMRERTEEIQKLTAHLQDIREEERTRIAREIHDELGQQLTGLKMDASWIGKKIKQEDLIIQQKVSTMISLIDETVKTVRRISSELRPGILDDLGLIPALEWQCQEFEKRTGIQSVCCADQFDFNPDRNLSTTIFRVYQEALTNVARHSQATQVVTTLEIDENVAKLTINDNGLGFDMTDVKTKNSLGLIGMRERALMVNGELEIKSEALKGTAIVLTVPLKKTDKLNP